jgi:hypothetical protein
LCRLRSPTRSISSSCRFTASVTLRLAPALGPLPLLPPHWINPPGAAYCCAAATPLRPLRCLLLRPAGAAAWPVASAQAWLTWRAAAASAALGCACSSATAAASELLCSSAEEMLMLGSTWTAAAAAAAARGIAQRGAA